jgi:hypothetical protein
MHARAAARSRLAPAIAALALACTAASRPDAATSDRPAAAARTARLCRGTGEHELARWLVAISIARSHGHTALVDETDRVVWGVRSTDGVVAIDDDVRATMDREPLASLTWLVGAWRGTREGATTTERWCPELDGRLVGDNRTVAASREVAFELLAIEQRDGIATYLARPGGRTPPTAFPREPGSDSTAARFADPTHDFPQVLDYVRAGDRLDVVARGGGHQLVFAWTGPSPAPSDPAAAAVELAAQCEAVRAANPRAIPSPP